MTRAPPSESGWGSSSSMGRGQQENCGTRCSSHRRSSAREMIVETLTPRASASAHRGSKVMGRSP
nr:MAG TPA: hypothetical protein [Caudoviricetes sp.]